MKKLISALLIGATLAMPMNMALCSADGEISVEQLALTSNSEANEQKVCFGKREDYKNQKIAKVKERLLIAAVVVLGALYLYEKSNNNSFLGKTIKRVEKVVSSISKFWNEANLVYVKSQLAKYEAELNILKNG